MPHATFPPPNNRQFCQIAVNSRYICYGLRAGQIRVLHKDTSERALLRGHTQMIGDMRFSPSSKDDIIASFGVDGNLLVKRIKFAENAIEEQPLLQVTVVNPPAGSVPRVRWISKSRIAASIGDAIFGVDVDLKAREPVVLTADLAAENSPGVIVFAPLGQKPSISDFAVSPEGALACAHADGTVRVYSDVGSLDATPSTPPPSSPDATFEPFSEDPDGSLASIAWVSRDALVVGGEANKALALCKLGSGDTVGAECVQTLKVTGDAYNFSCVAYPHARLVLLANLRKQSVYAVHLAAEAAGFDYVSEFSVTMPILSFTALKESDDPSVLQMYCMQTQAIQQYALHIDRCRPEGSEGDEGEYAADDDEADADADEGFESAEEEDETVAVPAITPAALNPATPTPTTPAPGSNKLLTPGELMSMASGGSAAASGAGSAPESPRTEGESKPPRSPGPPPPHPHHGHPPPPPPPPHHGHPPPPGPPGHHRGPPPPPGPHGPPHVHLEQSLATLRQQIGQDLSGFVTAMQAEREAAERERQKQLLTAVSAAITRDLPVQMEKIVTNIVKRELKAMAPALAADIAKAKSGGGDASSKEIVKALPGALATAMTGTVVPKFEAATREMFEQVKGAFEKGMDDIAQELYTQKENAIAAEATPLISSLRLASSEVRGAAEALLTAESIPGSKGAGSKTVQATSLEELEAAMDPTVELGRLVDEGNYEEAFQKALGMASVETVTWTCGRCEPVRDDIFGAVPVPLSQTVLLSLMQQLSSDLDDEPSLKLQWIQAACLAMDPSDQSLAQALPVILGAVFDSLTEAAQAPDTPAGVRGDLRLVLHVVNSLLSSFPK